jgi:Tol biopolymer transport system component
MLMGTLAYLAPEQVRGETADHRADIFSLGVVLYEMIVGERPFKGDSKPAILEAILLAEPAPITTRHSDLADGLTQIVVRALDKARDARHQSAGDLRDDLQRLLKKLESASTDVAGDARAYRPVRTGRRMLVRGAWLIVATAVPIAIWFGWQISMRKPEAAGATWANAVSRPLTAYKGEEFFPSLSPDARYFVYARRLDDDWDICLQRVGESHFDNLTSDSESDDTQPVYSPDGARLAFRSERNDGGIFLSDADGKNVTQIVNEGFNPAWSPDGKEIFYATASTVLPASRDTSHSELRAVNIATREKRTVFAGDAMQPHVSPRGLRVAYWAAQQGGQRDIWTVPSRGGVPAPVTNDAWTDWNPVWAPDGKYLYFSSDRQGVLSLWRAPIDEESGRPVGPPQAVTGPAVAFWHFSLSQDGKHLAFVQRIVRANINRIGFDPVKGAVVGERVQITQETRPVTAPDLSPNGEWLAWYSYGGAQEDIFIIKCDGGEQRQLTNDPCKDRMPRWSPDGGRVAFFSDCSGQYEVWTVNVETGERRRITYDNSHAGSVIPIWSPDGSRIVYHLRGLNTFIIDANKPWAEQNRIALAPMNEADQWLLVWSWSRDGEKLAGLRARPDRHLPGIFVYTLKSQQYQQVTKIGRDPVWLSDNRRLLFIHQRHIYLADSQTNTFRRLLSFDPYEIGQVVVSSDNQQIYFSLVEAEADISLLTLN